MASDPQPSPYERPGARVTRPGSHAPSPEPTAGGGQRPYLAHVLIVEFVLDLDRAGVGVNVEHSAVVAGRDLVLDPGVCRGRGESVTAPGVSQRGLHGFVDFVGRQEKKTRNGEQQLKNEKYRDLGTV